ncbi:hypothetical protein HGM15179_005275 [Zosterops borbonicus]|uniref:Uncharacterized protein n=1 Tax=Zosterops borbonicus TaxID=364589 RepID=A0A8K1LPZ6_9PASS|nr:hypothetical protein HGM15179_005275 [Zosterops borbonicus]
MEIYCVAEIQVQPVKDIPEAKGYALREAADHGHPLQEQYPEGMYPLGKTHAETASFNFKWITPSKTNDSTKFIAAERWMLSNPNNNKNPNRISSSFFTIDQISEDFQREAQCNGLTEQVLLDNQSKERQ